MNWIKYHALCVADYSLNPSINLNRSEFDQRMVEFLAVEDGQEGFSKEDVLTEVKRLFDTGQLKVIEHSGRVVLGAPIFEEAQPVSKAAEKAAQAIFENLSDRRGIKQELPKGDVLEELLNTMAVLIDKSFQPVGIVKGEERFVGGWGHVIQWDGGYDNLPKGTKLYIERD